MRLYVDTEFNEFRGSLISIGIASQHGQEFYEVCALPLREHYKEWVEANVLPVLHREPISRVQLQAHLVLWLRSLRPYGDDELTFIVDHPADAIHLCQLLEIDDQPGGWHDIGDFAIQFRTKLPGTADISECPHNAIADARALRDEGEEAERRRQLSERDE
jgi:hypothetical protein